PNFSTEWFRLKPTAFTQTINTNACAGVTFSVPPPISLLPGSACMAPSYSVLSQSWNFGDPLSGSSNTSSAANPTHNYSAPGTYTVKLALNFNCHTDTLRQLVTFTNTAPSLNVSGDVFLCEGESTVLMGTGATSYSWNGNPGTNTIAVTNPSANTVFTLSGILNGNLCVGEKTVMVTVSKCTFLAENIPNKSIRFYPNPASTNLTIESDSKTAIKIYNSLGQFVSRLELNPGKNEMSTVSLSNGLYFFKTENCETCEVSQLVIHRE
ncbi:MAG: T9SS type A sorting domain-containing protein, partial [Bacteroidia bacterium]|nr:T9SS type A sorting domain-containing protein [Bacteroidia bacterium]